MSDRSAARDAGSDGRQRIGPLGIVARLLLGGYLLLAVLGTPVPDRVDASMVLGFVGFPALLLGWQWWWTRRHPAPVRATGPVASVVNMAVVAALYLTPWYLPVLSLTSDAAMIFYGGSMLLAAARRYASCEVLAVPNLILRRDDRIGCLVFAPVDALERRYRRRASGVPAASRSKMLP